MINFHAFQINNITRRLIFLPTLTLICKHCILGTFPSSVKTKSTIKSPPWDLNPQPLRCLEHVLPLDNRASLVAKGSLIKNGQLMTLKLLEVNWMKNFFIHSESTEIHVMAKNLTYKRYTTLFGGYSCDNNENTWNLVTSDNFYWSWNCHWQFIIINTIFSIWTRRSFGHNFRFVYSMLCIADCRHGVLILNTPEVIVQVRTPGILFVFVQFLWFLHSYFYFGGLC